MMAFARLLQSHRSQPQSRWPPPEKQGSNAAERERLANEAREAAKRSDEIDKYLAKDKLERAKNDPQMRILLLGQAESGKSTTLKAFKLQYAPRQFTKELELWSAVILHNLVSGLTCVLDVLSHYETEHGGYDDISNGGPIPGSSHSNTMRSKKGSKDISHIPPMSRELVTLRLRLRPLVKCNASIRAWLDPTATSSPTYDSHFSTHTSSPSNASTMSIHEPPPNLMHRRGSQPDLAVRASHGKGFGLDFIKRSTTTSSGIDTYKSGIREKDYQAARTVIQACAQDMQTLLDDTTVKAILKYAEVDLTERYGYVLENLGRITKADYTPSAADVLRARLKTEGAQEHRIDVEHGMDTGKSWLMIDVGGSRKQRHTWASYFDNVHGIIFLAPLSTFNEELEEEKGVNRLEDTVHLWRDICSNKLLAHVHMILFMNKMDILEEKLKSGVRFDKYVQSYRGANDMAAITKYLQHKFTSIHHQYSPAQRQLGIFKTSVIDHRSTGAVLSAVRSAIMKSMLERTGML